MIGMKSIYFGVLVFKLKPSFKPPNIIVLYLYEDGYRQVEKEYVGGKLNGKYTRYYKNGNKQFEVEYKDDLLNGKYITWHRNGKKWREAKFKDGVEIK